MPLPIIANTVRVAVSGDGAVNSSWANVLHFRHPGGAPSPTDITALIGQVKRLYRGTPFTTGTGWWSTYASTLANQTKITVTPLDGTSATVVDTTTQAGAQAGDPLPGGVALVVTFRTALRGRSYRGRLYYAAFSEFVNASPGIPSLAMIADLLVQWNGLQTALTGISWEHVVASYLHQTATTVASYGIDNQWDSQRRRNAG